MSASYLGSSFLNAVDGSDPAPVGLDTLSHCLDLCTGFWYIPDPRWILPSIVPVWIPNRMPDESMFLGTIWFQAYLNIKIIKIFRKNMGSSDLKLPTHFKNQINPIRDRQSLTRRLNSVWQWRVLEVLVVKRRNIFRVLLLSPSI